MKLEKTLHYATFLAATFVVIFTVFVADILFFSNRSLEMEAHARKIRSSAFEFYSILATYAQHPEDSKSPPEWKAAYKQLDMLSAQSQPEFAGKDEKEILLTIHNNVLQIKRLFPRFLTPPRSSDISEPLSPVLHEQMKLQALRVLRLAGQMAKQRETAAEKRLSISFWIVATFFLGTMAFIAVALLWTQARLLQPLKALQAGAEKIWEGDFNHQLHLEQQDEIGYLSKTLDKMTAHLLELQKQIGSEAREKLEAQHELLDIQEMERKRIGQDLHDSIAQRLAGISFMAQVLGKKLSQRNAPEASDLLTLTEEIQKTLEETRQLAHGFHPVDLEHSGLLPALKNFAKTVESAFRVTCHFICTKEFSLEDPDTEAHLYRIAQEAAHNAIRHGKATEIRITLGKHLSEAVLEIADNGIGIPPGNTEMEKGIGFKSMRYRTALIHGHLSVEAPKDHGTRITVRCPLKLSQPHPDINTTYHLDFNPNKDQFF